MTGVAANLLVQKLIELALQEDLSFGDITSQLTVAPDALAHAHIVAREGLMVCGTELIGSILSCAHIEASLDIRASEGQWLESGAPIAELHGSAQGLLSVERTILNFLQRMSGVATYTARFIKGAHAPNIVVLDTRKTVPGWRVLDKHAVQIGGGRNHRAHLGDMVLVKNNHIDACPGKSRADRMRHALQGVQRGKPFWMPFEVEVRDLEELRVALEFKPLGIMLDNFTDEGIREALSVIRAEPYSPQVEVSGGIASDRVEELARLGVDCVSVGSLTSRAPAVDISMRIQFK